MKKVMSFLSVVALIATVNTSCKKNYTCECCANCTIYGSTTTTCSTATSGKIKKKDAKAWCESNRGSNASCTYKCDLK